MTLGARNLYWLAGATLIIICAMALSLISPFFAWDIDLSQRPIIQFVGIIAGSSALMALWFWAGVKMRLPELTRGDIFYKVAIVIFIVGILARIILWSSTPILEDDFYRYLWDGAVTASDLNPYIYAPFELATSPDVEALLNELNVSPDSLPEGYESLASEGKPVLLRVNNPTIATIYPPIVQSYFAIAHWIAPFDICGLRVMALIIEIAAFGILLLTLRHTNKGSFFLALYWWHPLVLKEFTNSVHMDVLLMPVLSAVTWLVISKRELIAQIFLGFAAAIKIWPLMLMPFVAGRNKRSIAYVVLATVILAALLLPQLFSLTADAGLVRYSQDWQRNALAFPLAQSTLTLLFEDPGKWLRLAIAAGFAGGIIAIWWRSGRSVSVRPGFRFVDLSIVAMTLLCLLIPTGYPWYALWVVPFLVIRPALPAAMLTLTCGFYYLDFYFQTIADAGPVIWLPAILSAFPIWCLLGWQLFKQRQVYAK